MRYEGVEKRRHARIKCGFLATYRELDNFGQRNKSDSSQLKDLSLGGMRFTTSEHFEKGTTLALKIRLPFVHYPVMPKGKVIESREIIKGLLYDTRLEFSEIVEYDNKIISEVLTNYLKTQETK